MYVEPPLSSLADTAQHTHAPHIAQEAMNQEKRQSAHNDRLTRSTSPRQGYQVSASCTSPPRTHSFNTFHATSYCRTRVSSLEHAVCSMANMAGRRPTQLSVPECTISTPPAIKLARHAHLLFPFMHAFQTLGSGATDGLYFGA
jgi:hypothetical protein